MQEPHAAQRPQQLPRQGQLAEGAQGPTLTHRAPSTCFLYTYCIALLIGDRVELSAIVERGVNPTPLVCRLPEWPETAGRMQGEQQQSREQRREEEKIKGENKRVGNNTVRTAVRLEGENRAQCWVSAEEPSSASVPTCSLPSGTWDNLSSRRDRSESFGSAREASAPCHSITLTPEKPGDTASDLPRGRGRAPGSCYPLSAPKPHFLSPRRATNWHLECPGGLLQWNLTWFAVPSPFPAGQARQQTGGLDHGGWWAQKGTS